MVLSTGGGFDGDVPLELGVKLLDTDDWNPEETTYNTEAILPTGPDFQDEVIPWIQPGAEQNTVNDIVSIPVEYQTTNSGTMSWDVTEMVRFANHGYVSFLVTPLDGTSGFREINAHDAEDGLRMQLPITVAEEVVEPVDPEPVDPPTDPVDPPVDPDPVDPDPCLLYTSDAADE